MRTTPPLLLLSVLACRGKDVPDTAFDGDPGFDSGAIDSPGDSSEPPLEDYPVDRVCVSSAFTEEPSALALAATQGQTLFFMRANGDIEEAWTFGAELAPPSDATLSINVSISGEYIGAVAAWSSRSEASGGWSELVLFDREGGVVFSSSEGASTSTQLRVGSSGVIVYDRGYVDNNSTLGRRAGLLLSADGVEELDGVRPIGPPNSEGWLLGCALDDSSCAWVKPGEDPLFSRDLSASALVQVPRWFVAMAQPDEDASPALIWSDADGEHTQDLSEAFRNVDAAELEVLSANSAGWVLVGRQTSGEEPPRLNTLVRINVNDGSYDAINPNLPTDQRRFWDPGCPSPLVQLTTSGELLLQLRDDAEGGLYHGGSDGSAWTRWGTPMTALYGAWPLENAGTVQLLSSSGANSFCPTASWVDPQDGAERLSGDSVQLLLNDGAGPSLTLAPHRGDDGRWPLRPLMFSSDGQCGLYDDPDSELLETQIVDVAAGERVTLDPSYEGWRWLY